MTHSLPKKYLCAEIIDMQLFYATNISGEYATFDEVEARHCVQVLRKKVGETIHFVNGKGGWFEGVIDETGKKKLVVKITGRKELPPPSPVQLHVAIAPTKNIDRIEWFLEKATEVGVTSFNPIICERSERRRIRPERLEKILLSAMKQSLKAHLPELNEMIGFQDFIKKHATQSEGQRFIAHCQKDDLPLLKNNCEPRKDVIILIGPEGDFSPDEIELAKANGFIEISLGKSRLRTETAGLAAVFTVNFLNE